MKTYTEIKRDLYNLEGMQYITVNKSKGEILMYINEGYKWNHPNEIIKDFLLDENAYNIHDKVSIGGRIFRIWEYSYSDNTNEQITLTLKELTTKQYKELYNTYKDSYLIVMGYEPIDEDDEYFEHGFIMPDDKLDEFKTPEEYAKTCMSNGAIKSIEEIKYTVLDYHKSSDSYMLHVNNMNGIQYADRISGWIGEIRR